MADQLSVILDTAEPRVLRDAIAVTCDSRHWDPLVTSNAYVDPITGMVFLQPVQMHPDWQTTGTGAYARLPKSGFTLTSALWAEHNVRFTGDVYLLGLNTNEVVYTVSTYPANRAMFLSWFAYNPGNAEWVQMECGWAEGLSGDTRLRFWSTGRVEVWRGATMLRNDLYITPQANQVALPTQLAQKTVDVYMIPCRGRDLLVFSNQGGGFCYTFEDIEEGAADPTIVGGGAFWFQVPSGQPMVQCTPMNFATSGYVRTEPFDLIRPPAVGDTPTTAVVKTDPGFGTCTATATWKDAAGATFTPDGVETTITLQVDLDSDETASPAVECAWLQVPVETQDTDGDHSTVLDDWWESLALDIPDEPAGCRMDLQLHAPEEIEAAGASKLLTVSNRHIEVKLGDVTIFRGRTEPPAFADAVPDDVRGGTLTARSRWSTLEQFKITDCIPLNGMNLTAALKFLAKLPGTYTDADLDIEETEFDLPPAQNAANGEYTLWPEPGDTPAQWILRLLEDYARNWFIGEVPTSTGIQLKMCSIATLGTTPAWTLYGTMEEAEAYLLGLELYTPEEIAVLRHRYVYHFAEVKQVPPEANWVRVVGWDAKTETPIYAQDEDAASMAPDTAPADRPDNWRGEPWRYQLFEPALCTQDATDDAFDTIWDRLTFSGKVGEVRCQMIVLDTGVPLWRGGILQLGDHGIFRVLDMRPYTDTEGPTDIEIDRPTTYYVEWVADIPAEEPAA